MTPRPFDTVGDLVAHLQRLMDAHPALATYRVVLDRGRGVRAESWSGQTFIDSAAETLELER